MLILRGKNRGIHTNIHQFCNDWFMGKNGKVYSPMSIQLSPEEVEEVIEQHKKGNVGIMFNLYWLDAGAGRFRKNKGVHRTRKGVYFPTELVNGE